MMKRNIFSKYGSSSDIFCVLLSLEKEKVKVKVSLSCLTLCDHMDYAVHGTYHLADHALITWLIIH